jgi:uncharacterized membrane protein YraQ (UPF0718 family)
MKNGTVKKKTKWPPFLWGMLFLSLILLVYGILILILPEKTHAALRESGKIAANLLWPVLLVLFVMMILNLFAHPGKIVQLVGEKAGSRGLLLAAAAGIISMGPIYAWYPFLKDMRAKGAGPKPIAVFLGNRAVKPVLLPIMLSYFGWLYTILFAVMTFIGAMALGYLMGFFVEK